MLQWRSENALFELQSDLDYLDLLGPRQIVWIIKSLDNQKYEY